MTKSVWDEEWALSQAVSWTSVGTLSEWWKVYGTKNEHYLKLRPEDYAWLYPSPMILLGLAARLSSNSSETKYMGVKPLHSPMLKEVHASFLKSICVATYRRKAKKRRLIGLEKKWAVNVVRWWEEEGNGKKERISGELEARNGGGEMFYQLTLLFMGKQFFRLFWFFSPRFCCRFKFQLLLFLWQDNSFQMANNDSRQNQPKNKTYWEPWRVYLTTSFRLGV